MTEFEVPLIHKVKEGPPKFVFTAIWISRYSDVYEASMNSKDNNIK